jgi:hypothetical protein
MTYSRELLGMAVFTADGESLGRVKAVDGGYFAVDVSLRPDYWLPMDLIHTVTTVVGLTITQAEIAAHKLDLPAPAPLAS